MKGAKGIGLFCIFKSKPTRIPARLATKSTINTPISPKGKVKADKNHTSPSPNLRRTAKRNSSKSPSISPASSTRRKTTSNGSHPARPPERISNSAKPASSGSSQNKKGIRSVRISTKLTSTAARKKHQAETGKRKIIMPSTPFSLIMYHTNVRIIAKTGNLDKQTGKKIKNML